MQRKIIHSPKPQRSQIRRAASNTIHERAAYRAKVAVHFMARCDCVSLDVAGQSILTSKVGEMGGADEQIGREHGAGDFATTVEGEEGGLSERTT